MKGQTAVEWLVQHLSERGYIQAPSFGHSIIDKAIQQAKEMEKAQIEMAHYNGSVVTISKPDDDMLKLAEQYYKRTFKSE